MAFDAGTIIGHLKLDTGGFASGILQAQGLSRLFGETISTFLANPLLGVATLAKQAAGALVNLVTSTAASADQFAKLSVSTNASVEFLSGLTYAAELSGLAFEQLREPLSKLPKVAADAASGAGAAVGAFRQLGISVTDAAGALRGGDALFLDIAEGLRNVENETLRTALAQQIFGESAGRMVPLLAQGRDGITAMIGEAQRLGLTFDGASAKAAERFNDAMTRVKATLQGAAQQIAIPIFEALGPVLEGLAETLGKVLGPVLQPVVALFEAILPVLEPLMGLIGSIAGLIGSVLTPVLQALRPLLELLGMIVGAIAKGIGALVDAISGPLRTVAGWLGGGTSPPQTTVNVQVAPDESARRVADRIAPAIADGVRGVQYRVEDASRRRMDLHDYQAGFALR